MHEDTYMYVYLQGNRLLRTTMEAQGMAMSSYPGYASTDEK